MKNISTNSPKNSQSLRLFPLLFLLILFTFFIGAAYAQDESENSTEINVRNAEIESVIKIFSKKTKRNYILDERVKGKISIFLPGKVADADAEKILESVLNYKGFASVPIGENLWKIVPSKDAIQSTIPTVDQVSRNDAPNVVTKVINLKNTGADEIQQLISPLVSGTGLLSAYGATNSLLIIDSADNIARITNIVESLDVAFSDRELTIIPVEHADASDIAEKLLEIIKENESGETDTDVRTSAVSARLSQIRERIRQASGTTNAGGADGGSSKLSGDTIASRSREPKIISDERTNSIIVVADETTTARIRALIATLDSELDVGGFRFFVYKCQHASAEDLADVLAGLSGDGSSRGSLARDPDVLRGSSLSSGRNNSSTQNRLASQRRTPGQSRNTGTDSGGVASASLGEDISITADPATNSLIVYADNTGYQKVLTLLEQLDVKRRQVLVEAVLLEVGITENEESGVSFLSSAGGADGGVFAQSNFNGNLASLFTNPQGLQNFTIAAASSGSLTLPGDITIPTQTVLLNAARSAQNVNVLSAPTILATDNEQAEIVVGQNVPFLASTSTNDTNLNNTFNQIDRQDVGITLRIVPQISSSDTVRLEIFTEVSSVVLATASSDLGPTTTVRTSETVAIAKDSQMVVIGGLMSEDISDTSSGVPFLRDIPVFGQFFGTSSDAISKSNLLIFITPRVIKDQFDARDATLLRRDRMEGEISTSEIYPDRREVLRSENLDNVAEAKEFKGEKPSTIRIPAEEKQQSSSALEVEVKPNFFSKKEPPQKNTRSANLAENSQALVALKLLGEANNLDSAPFGALVEKDHLAVQIPESALARLDQFLKPGTVLRYQKNDFKILGRAKDLASLSAQFGTSKNSAHTLSPYEVMTFGSGLWKIVP